MATQVVSFDLVFISFQKKLILSRNKVFEFWLGISSQKSETYEPPSLEPRPSSLRSARPSWRGPGKTAGHLGNCKVDGSNHPRGLLWFSLLIRCTCRATVRCSWHDHDAVRDSCKSWHSCRSYEDVVLFWGGKEGRWWGGGLALAIFGEDRWYRYVAWAQSCSIQLSVMADIPFKRKDTQASSQLSTGFNILIFLSESTPLLNLSVSSSEKPVCWRAALMPSSAFSTLNLVLHERNQWRNQNNDGGVCRHRISNAAELIH